MTQPPRLIRMAEITQLIGVKRGAINRRVAAGSFPAPKKIGRSIAWLESDIKTFLESLPNAIYKNGGGK